VEVMEKIAEATCEFEVDTTDGVKILTEEGWVIIRPSGTEPIFRCFAEAKNEDDVKKMVEWGISLVLEQLKS
jgi:phosphomannomutase/phosphoglucomutase